MMISIPILAEALQKKGRIDYRIQDQASISLSNVRYYHGNTELKSHTLYLVSYDEMTLNTICELPEYLMIQCSREVFDRRKELCEKAKNILWFESDDINTVFEQVQDIFDDYHALYNIIIEAGLNYGSSSLVEVLNRIAQSVGNPIFIMDNKHTLYNYSHQYFETCDPYWREIIEKGILNSEISETLKREKIIEIGDYYAVSRISGHGKWQSGYVLYNYEDQHQTTLSFIMVMIESYRSIKQSYEQLLICFAKIIRTLFKRDFMLHFSKVGLLERLIFQVLNNRKIEEEVLNSALLKNHWKNGEGFILSRIIKKNTCSEKDKQQMLRTLKMQFTNSIAVVPAFNRIDNTVYKVENEIIMLTFSGKDQFNLQEFYAQLECFLQKNKIQAAVSDQFYYFEELNRYYQNMEFMVTTCLKQMPNQALFCYDQYYNLLIIRTLSQQGDLQRFCHPDAEKLRMYDREHQSQLLKTLYYYWKANHSLIEAAQMLCIHRNTLVYRLEKIRMLLGKESLSHTYTTRMAFTYEVFRYINTI